MTVGPVEVRQALERIRGRVRRTPVIEVVVEIPAGSRNKYEFDEQARVIRLDDSDTNVFDPAAEPGEWAIPGTFEFANWTEADLEGVAKIAHHVHVDVDRLTALQIVRQWIGDHEHRRNPARPLTLAGYHVFVTEKA